MRPRESRNSPRCRPPRRPSHGNEPGPHHLQHQRVSASLFLHQFLPRPHLPTMVILIPIDVDVSDLRPLFSAPTSNASNLLPPAPSRPAPSSRSTSSNAISSVQPRSSSSSVPPPLPSRPRTLNSVVNRTAANYGPYGPGVNRYGTAAGAGYGYGSAYGSYASPYSRYGGGGMYGGYGGGGLFGAGGYGAYGAGPYGGAGGPFQPDPNDPNSLTNTLGQSTQATFQIIESIVGAFGGFAQMLESTYMATHSSFFGQSFLFPFH